MDRPIVKLALLIFATPRTAWKVLQYSLPRYAPVTAARRGNFQLGRIKWQV
jgi:hypothetical protein